LKNNPFKLINSRFGPILICENDTHIKDGIIIKGYWENIEIEAFHTILKKRKSNNTYPVFLDGGSNIGTHSIALSKLLDSKIEIHSFEAQTMLQTVALINFKLHNIKNVNHYNLAISDKTGETIHFRKPDYHSRNNFGGLELIQPRNSDNRDMKWDGWGRVETSTIDAFDFNVDLIKLDIEGMEDKAVRGAANTISRCRPAVYCEMTKTDECFILNYFNEIDYTKTPVRDGVIFQPTENSIPV